MRLLVLCWAAVLLSGCAANAAQNPPVLQRYQDLRPPLATVTGMSAILSTDVIRLNQRLSRDDIRGIRRACVGLQHHARIQEAATGASAYTLRRLLGEPSATAIRLYLRTIVHALARQWAEAHALARAASVVWHNPLLLDPRAVSRLWRLNTVAHWNARRAVQLTRYAAWWKQTHRRLFRYVPVRTH